MRKVQHMATLDEKSVQKIAAGEVKKVKKRRGSDLAPRSSRTTVKTVNNLVQKKVLELAKGDVARVIYIDENTAIVMNHPKQFTKKQFVA